ncbi:hypothetical protein SaccyDRAFT_5115 [Saccharomonospora cyanea NA-134]|uniref:Uncharacterized protein n=2 Tax=Saccharomonospora cyanea TaxID=40989 RepID=H5XRG4_9PSEU|nr:hypothetical protein SaccyDRAFT_5115 [Saccharomonospora cyanea NA-134]
MACMSAKRSGVDRARAFLLTHARPLERRLSEVVLTEVARPEAALAVLDLLRGHRNADGGLGHALEPDVRAPTSQPLAVDFALDVVEQVLDSPTGDVDEVRAACRSFARSLVPYLESVTTPDGGVPIVVDSVAEFPRAAHWGDGRFPAGLNPTAGIATRLRKAGMTAPWLDAADEFCRSRIESLTEWDGHSMLNVVTYLGGVDDRGWAARQLDVVQARLADLPHFNLYPAEKYGVTPLDVAPRPDDPGRALFPAAAVEAHLDFCEAAQTDDGGWELSWEPPGPAAELEWRGVLAVRNARLLLLNGRD